MPESALHHRHRLSFGKGSRLEQLTGALGSGSRAATRQVSVGPCSASAGGGPGDATQESKLGADCLALAPDQGNPPRGFARRRLRDRLLDQHWLRLLLENL